MAIKWMTHVWDNSKQTGTALNLMIAIADKADENGEAWPGNEYLATRCRVSPRHIQRLIGRLIDEGELEIIDPGGTGPRHTRRIKIKGDTHVTHGKIRVTSLHNKGDIPAQIRVTPTSPDTSIDTSRDTSHARTREAEGLHEGKEEPPLSSPPRNSSPSGFPRPLSVEDLNRKRIPPPLEAVEYYFRTVLRPDPRWPGITQVNWEKEARKFWNHFTSNGWKVGGKTKMRDWFSSAQNWADHDFGKPEKNGLLPELKAKVY